MTNPTRNEVALRAGVSTATVSRVLSPQSRSHVSEPLRARVLAVAEELGYKPNTAARALRSGRTRTIAWWAADCFTPFYAHVGRHVIEEGIHRCYHVLVHSAQHHETRRPGTPALSPWGVDGVLGYDIHARNGLITSLYGADTPVVSMGTFHDEGSDLVSVDLYAGAAEAVAHLIRPGCRRIAFFQIEDSPGRLDARSQAYRDILHEAGLPLERVMLRDLERHHARQVVVDYARHRGLPDAIFCMNDDVAIGCYRGLRDLGARIPDDVALVGCDGISELEYLEPPISTIVQPVAQMCKQAWEFLERRIDDPARPLQEATWPSRLVVRASSQR